MAQQQDWHQIDIVAAIHKKRIGWAALSRQAGLIEFTIANRQFNNFLI
ncbi:helix-turn-helix domain-containing protein [Pectobacterium brasiliense]|nr:helix-turn-helix domain-containing protein [Pectobacterium brasiliense]